MAAMKNGNGSKATLEEKLWIAADKMRGHMDTAEYKHVFLGLIFLKYISDTYTEPHNSQRPDKNISSVPPEARWSYLRSQAQSPNIGQMIDNAMTLIEEENPFLRDALPKGYARPSLNQQRLSELIRLIDTIILVDEGNHAKDILGRIYEYFLGRFASLEGKGGEFYTPQSVVKLLVEMIEPYKGSVYDPCCGSGGIFVQSEKFVLAHGGHLDDLSIYGQELNPTTWRLCKMNLAIRGIKGDIGIRHADAFHDDLHKGLYADYILANPPFNVSDWGGERLRHDKRWKYGTPSAGNANAAWIQHIIHHLSPSGTAGFVLTNGSLSVGQAEGEIRRAIIEADLVDCIVALPPQLFYNTQIATCLWFLTRGKKNLILRNRSNQTLFIYAHQLGRMTDRTHRELTDEEIMLIASTYHQWRNREYLSEYQDIPGFCKSVTIDEIKAHNYALVPGRYVGFGKNPASDWDISRLRDEFTYVEARFAEASKASEAALTLLKEILYG